MKTTSQFTMNQQDPNLDPFNQFNASSLTYREMFAVRGGDKTKRDIDEGSTADQQDDGFN